MKSSKSTKVITPRNVDLPPHVLSKDFASGPQGPFPRKKCLCLSLWLLGLLLLCIGAVAALNFVLPDVLLSSNGGVPEVYGLMRSEECPNEDGSSLDYRVSASDVILVGSKSPLLSGEEDEGGLRAERVLKGSLMRRELFGGPCAVSLSEGKRVFFLEHVDESLRLKFPSLLASDKLIRVIRKLLETEASSGSNVEGCRHSNCRFGASCIVDAKSGDSYCDCKGIDCSGRINKPVCGSDHITYKNECDLLQAGCTKRINLTVISDLPCEEAHLCGSKGCPFGGSCKIKKICGNNNKIYKSQCHMELDACESRLTNLTMSSHDNCYSCSQTCKWNEDCLYSEKSGKSLCSCPECPSAGNEEEDPVCGTDNITYDSVCSLRASTCSKKRGNDVRVKYPGVCRTIKYEKPIPCGKSSCDFGAVCEEDSYCVCSVTCKEEEQFPKYYAGAVCGSDGRTYETECDLRRHACKMQKEIVVADFKPCTRGATRIGDYCLHEESDCLALNSECVNNRCICPEGTSPNSANTSCEIMKIGSLCDPNPCQGGGTCDEHDGTFSCYCRSGLTGSRCEHDLSLTDMNTASFTGQDSHVEIKIPTDSVKRMEIEIMFRTFNVQEGLLLYGQSENENDFISLGIMDGHIIFSYDLGSGAVTLKSHGKIEKGKWTHLVAKRYHQDGLLELERTDKVIGSTRGSLRTLSLQGHLWIGGVDPNDFPLMYKVRKNAGTSIGFVGCIKELKINKKTISLQSMREPLVIRRRGLVECEENSCSGNPCKNEGLCISQVQGFLCHCKRDFTGKSCQRRRNDQCDPNPCQNNGVCHIKDRGFVCVCSGSEYYGTYCDLKTADTPNDQPAYGSAKAPKTHFNNTLAFDLKKSLGLTEEALMELEVSFLKKDPGSLGRLKISSTKTGLLKLQLSDSQGALTEWITSPPFFVSDNRPHNIILNIYRGELDLDVDGMSAFTAVNIDESFHILGFKGLARRQNGCLTNIRLSLSSDSTSSMNEREEIVEPPDSC
ncbi:unnamed protein product [Lepeophtheirus salmonis]|uniref:(salmon louse) hypothetical protein n=2 Tax=Lepeophtheirus salmonis TaxID=72036 RepID=A0A7R8H5P2_LEPSM|nr:unnamed protein product [Lepeophtheirus salmonis]CAF2887038.1 unnamed protein product [Lepeophtheirus salmonis]